MARDHAEAPLDLNTLMVARPAATFFMRMRGDAMAPFIHDGDLLVVDRSLTPRPGHIVVASADGRWLTRRWDRLPAGTTGTEGRPGTARATPGDSPQDFSQGPSQGFSQGGATPAVILRAENPRHAMLHPHTLPDFQLFGVVTWIVRKTTGEPDHTERGPRSQSPGASSPWHRV